LSPGKQFIVRHRDPAYYHLRRCENYRRLRLPVSEDWPRHLIGSVAGNAARSVAST
jgi:hypothetical protein